MKGETFSRGLLKFFSVAFSIMFAIVLVATIFFSDYFYGRELIKQMLYFVVIFFVFMCGLALIGLVSRNGKKLLLLCKQRYKLLFVFAFVILFVFQFVVMHSIYSHIGWDVEMLFNTAISKDMQQLGGYFSIYPNNLLLLFLFRALVGLQTVLGLQFSPWLVLGTVNVFAVCLSVVMVVLLAKRMLGFKMAAIVYSLSFALLGFFPWLMVPYSDTLTMPFVVAIVYFYYLLCESKGKRKYFYAFVIGLSAIVGVLVKPGVIIMLVAAVLVHFVWMMANFKEERKNWKYALLVVCTMLAIYIGWNAFVSAQNMIDIEPGRSASLSSYFMMGMRETQHIVDGLPQFGGWNREDMYAAFGHETTEAMDKFCKEQIVVRFNEYGLFGYLDFLAKKLAWILGDGTFFWGREGLFADFNYSNVNLFRTIFYPEGSRYDFYINASQGLWMLILGGVVLSGFLVKKMVIYAIYR